MHNTTKNLFGVEAEREEEEDPKSSFMKTRETQGTLALFILPYSSRQKHLRYSWGDLDTTQCQARLEVQAAAR